MIRVEKFRKSFILHNQGGARIPVIKDISLSVNRGDCLVLTGSSGTGKSTLLKSIYANYVSQEGHILIKHKGRWIDLVGAKPNVVLDIRRQTLGYVSQFLRVIPRIPTLDLIIEPLLNTQLDFKTIEIRAKSLLKRLAIPKKLWLIPPATFSGGEKQRINIAITFIKNYSILLLDEPTASLDDENKQAVVDLINEARKNGCAIIGIFHDPYVRESVGTHFYNVEH